MSPTLPFILVNVFTTVVVVVAMLFGVTPPKPKFIFGGWFAIQLAAYSLYLAVSP